MTSIKIKNSFQSCPPIPSFSSSIRKTDLCCFFAKGRRARGEGRGWNSVESGAKQGKSDGAMQKRDNEGS